MRLAEFDYPLDPERIAQHPLPQRDQSRLLVLHRDSGAVEHRRFCDLGEYLTDRDALVLNNTRVIPARLRGHKEPTGGAVEVLLLRRIDGDRWEALVKGKVRKGSWIRFDPGCRGEIVEEREGTRILRLESSEDWKTVLDRIGEIPLPPYIRRDSSAEDRETYQTVYASREGAVAAPTVGLHFTESMLRDLESRGVGLIYVTLHVGAGTFRPVREEEAIEKHTMDPEAFEIDEKAAEAVRRVRRDGGRIVAVGTTAVRVLESSWGEDGPRPARGETRLFIYPGYVFRGVDALLTNFHLPRTTLLMLAAAFGGKDPVMRAYREAVEAGYRFYSYGDAMLIL